MRPSGFLYCTGIKDAEGKAIPLDQAIRYGWIRPGEVPDGFSLPPGAVPIGSNLFVDGGRQYTVYALAFRSPAQNYSMQKFGTGTGVRPASATDVALVNPVAFASGLFTKNLDAVEFPAPFTLRAVFTLGANDCNGYLLTEFGLFSGDSTLLTRVVRPGISKSSDFSPTLSHELRFALVGPLLTLSSSIITTVLLAHKFITIFC